MLIFTLESMFAGRRAPLAVRQWRASGVATLFFLSWLGVTGLAQGGRFAVQFGAAPERAEAEARLTALTARGVQAYIVKSQVRGKGLFYRVRAGNFPSRPAAEKYGAQLKTQGIVAEYFVADYETPEAPALSAKPAAALATAAAPTAATPAGTKTAPLASSTTAAGGSPTTAKEAASAPLVASKGPALSSSSTAATPTGTTGAPVPSARSTNPAAAATTAPPVTPASPSKPASTPPVSASPNSPVSTAPARPQPRTTPLPPVTTTVKPPAAVPSATGANSAGVAPATGNLAGGTTAKPAPNTAPLTAAPATPNANIATTPATTTASAFVKYADPSIGYSFEHPQYWVGGPLGSGEPQPQGQAARMTAGAMFKSNEDTAFLNAIWNRLDKANSEEHNNDMIVDLILKSMRSGNGTQNMVDTNRVVVNEGGNIKTYLDLKAAFQVPNQPAPLDFLGKGVIIRANKGILLVVAFYAKDAPPPVALSAERIIKTARTPE